MEAFVDAFLKFTLMEASMRAVVDFPKASEEVTSTEAFAEASYENCVHVCSQGSFRGSVRGRFCVSYFHANFHKSVHDNSESFA